jgi:serine/threonine-protein kinase
VGIWSHARFAHDCVNFSAGTVVADPIIVASANGHTSTRYIPLGTLASGGMGTVSLARAKGSAGFSRLVAIKRLHPQLAAQKEFIARLVDEARLASGLHHVNIVDTLDLVVDDGAFTLVLEYIEGAAASVLVKEAHLAGETIPRPIALAMIQGVLRGLEAAHEARSPDGAPLGIVHRDISPQNVLVGTDGVARIIDFGIAKALGRVANTATGELHGKFAYIAPEQLLEKPATRQADIYAVGVILWELLTGKRLFTGEDHRAVCAQVMRGNIPRPSSICPDIPPELDELVLRATASELSERYFSARELLADLAPFERASDDEVGRWVRRIAAEYLAERNALLQNDDPSPAQSLDHLLEELHAPRPTPRTGSVRIPSTRPAPPSLPPLEYEPAGTARESTPALIVPYLPPAPRSSPIPHGAAFYASAVGLLVVALGVGFLDLRHQQHSPPVAVTAAAKAAPPVVTHAVDLFARPSDPPPIAVTSAPSVAPPPQPIVRRPSFIRKAFTKKPTTEKQPQPASTGDFEYR